MSSSSSKKQSLGEKIVDTKIIRTLDKLDKTVSSYIHNLYLPKFIQFYISIWAQIFNKEGPMFLNYAIATFLPLFQAEKDREPYYFLYHWFQYFAQGMTVFIAVVMTKKYFRRNRPVVTQTMPKRYYNLRGKEIDCSWPSGDTAQCAIFVMFLWQNFNDLVLRVPGGWGWTLLFLTVIHVAFGRIFFHCHYIGDTIGGFLFGWCVAHINQFLTNVLVQ